MIFHPLAWNLLKRFLFWTVGNTFLREKLIYSRLTDWFCFRWVSIRPRSDYLAYENGRFINLNRVLKSIAAVSSNFDKSSASFLSHSQSDLLHVFGLSAKKIVWTLVNGHWNKVGYVLLMVVVSLLPQAEIGRNDHRENSPHFIFFSNLAKLNPGGLKCGVSTLDKMNWSLDDYGIESGDLIELNWLIRTVH